MKYIKKYEKAKKSFIFAIDIRNASDEQLIDIIEQYRKHFDMRFDDDFLDESNLDEIKKYWALIFNMYYSLIDLNKQSVRTSLVKVQTPGWGSGYKYMDDIIIIDDFLSIGFGGIKDEIETKNNANKYNLW